MLIPAFAYSQNNINNESNDINTNTNDAEAKNTNTDNTEVNNENEKDTTENEYGAVVFTQKGGLLEKGDLSVYLRTNDEWTGFSTFYLGFRFQPLTWANFAVEIAASPIPHVYLGGFNIQMELYETPEKWVFIGMRLRSGFKYQDSDFTGWFPDFPNYLTLQRSSIYLAADFTISFRIGKEKRHSIYYSIYPRWDFSLASDDMYPVFFLFSPVMIGYEVRFGTRRRWNFAIEAGYAFPIPWDSVPEGMWVNFPSLANITLSYRW